jgi:carbon storage regulator CsrA
MLVLSRRPHEKIVFPSINTVIQVVALKPGVVRLGIQAPDDLPVFRQEVLDQQPASTWPAPSALAAEARLRQLTHALNTRLNSGTIALALLRRQLELGRPADGLATLGKLDEELASLKQAVTPVCAPATGPRRRALLVEDDHNERELLAGFLRLAGLEVSTAGDGADALEHLRHQRPDVVLLDMLLPRVDGPSTVRAIRGEPTYRDLVIFGVTGADRALFNLPEGPAGIDQWFLKPLDPEALLREMHRHLEG